jgi:ATP-dependent protease ClpP protease subunit
MRLLTVLLSVAFAGCLTNPPAIEKIGEDEYKVVGKLHKSEYDEIISIVNQHPHQHINFYVTSYGGTSEDLLPAMDAVHNHGMTHWYTVDQCDSACAVMALATNHANGTLKLHSFYSRHHHEVQAAPGYNHIILDRLESYGYDRTKLTPMFRSVDRMCPITVLDGKIIE